ncbi:MAG TPA: hypothetical protein VF624_06070 [Tepidisphaeraceae bacterium]|jgi:hypothetical protein
MTEAQTTLPPAPGAERPIPQQPIAAPGSRYYRSRRYIIAVALLGFAAYFAYDGWKGYPRANARIDVVEREIASLAGATRPEDIKKLADLDKEKKSLGSRKSDTSIRLQKQLAVGLPFLAAGFLAFILHRSRGQVRLENDTLHVPGHPPVPLGSITAVDGRLWAKKGIAYVDYDVGGKGRAKLDAFIYEPAPMDDLYEVVARRHGVWEATKPRKA